MPTSSGPNTLGESNLVFAYDTGDVSNSYRGEPTTNLAPNSEDFTQWLGNLFSNWINSDITANASLAPNGTLTADRFGNGYSRYTNSITATTNTLYTFSVWIKNVSLTGTGVQLYWSFGNNGSLVSYGNGLTISPSTLSTTEWQRFSFTVNSPSSGINQMQFGIVSFTGYGNNTGGQTFDAWGGQVEQKSHVTPYTPGTRSATQGLLPVIGNSTIDLTNVSFDSNAQMTFDGTNDYASVTLPSSIGVYCLEMVWYNNNAIPNNDTVIGGPATYQTPIEFNGTGQGVHLGAWTGGFTNEAIHIWGASGATANQVAAGVGYHHVVFNWNGTTYDIWVDGINTPTQYLSGNSPATLLTASSIKMGNDVSGYAFNGQIPITKIYNRALTAQEVKQNYQQYKTRFNLS
jgi:hypothetical protein